MHPHGVAIVLVGAGAGAYGVDRWTLPWLREIAGQRLIRAGLVAAIAVGVAFTAWLAWITTDTQTWLVAGVIAAGVAAVARTALPHGRPVSATGERLRA